MYSSPFISGQSFKHSIDNRSGSIAFDHERDILHFKGELAILFSIEFLMGGREGLAREVCKLVRLNN